MYVVHSPYGTASIVINCICFIVPTFFSEFTFVKKTYILILLSYSFKFFCDQTNYTSINDPIDDKF